MLNGQKRLEAVRFAREKLSEHGLGGVEVEISTRSRRSLGMAKFRNGRPFALVLAAWLLERAEWELIEETILHEVAHLIAGHAAGHGPRWKAIARQLGARPIACATDVTGAPPAKWVGVCAAGCDGVRYERHRLAERIRKYGLCPKCRGKLRWTSSS